MESNNKTTVIYFVDGVVASPEEVKTIKAFEQKRTDSRKQAEEGLTENQVKPMVYKMGAINTIKVDGEVYEVSHESEVVGA